MYFWSSNIKGGVYMFYLIFTAVGMSSSWRRDQNTGLYPFSWEPLLHGVKPALQCLLLWLSEFWIPLWAGPAPVGRAETSLSLSSAASRALYEVGCTWGGVPSFPGELLALGYYLKVTIPPSVDMFLDYHVVRCCLAVVSRAVASLASSVVITSDHMVLGSATSRCWSGWKLHFSSPSILFWENESWSNSSHSWMMVVLMGT